MPFRQLPGTDETRNRALKDAKKKKDSVAPADIVLTPNTITRLDDTQPVFADLMAVRTLALQAQVTITKQVTEAKDKLALFISHFIQSFNHGILRGLFPEEARTFYNIPVHDSTIPELKSEADILSWGERIIDGDAARTAAGGADMGFPDINEITDAYNDFNDKNIEQSNLKDAYDNAQEAVDDMRDDADALILRIWDEVETAFNDEDPPSLRRKAREWGVVYVASPGEEPEQPVTGTIVFATNQTVPGQVTFELAGKDGKEVTIDMGDGSIINVILQSGINTYSYTYTTGGHYTIQIEGTTIAIAKLKGKNNHFTATNLPEEGLLIIEMDISENEQGSMHIPATNTQMKVFKAKNNNFDLQSINSILVTFDSFGTNDGEIDLRGPNMETPTGAGLVAMNALIARGWTVKTN